MAPGAVSGRAKFRIEIWRVGLVDLAASLRPEASLRFARGRGATAQESSLNQIRARVRPAGRGWVLRPG